MKWTKSNGLRLLIRCVVLFTSDDIITNEWKAHKNASSDSDPTRFISNARNAIHCCERLREREREMSVRSSSSYKFEHFPCRKLYGGYARHKHPTYTKQIYLRCVLQRSNPYHLWILDAFFAYSAHKLIWVNLNEPVYKCVCVCACGWGRFFAIS